MIVPRFVVLLVLVGSCLACPRVEAGHEMPFYPSYYPQEITVESVAPAAAGPRLEKNALHAYVGGDPFAGRPTPSRIGAVESLGSYVVLTFNPSSPAVATRDARCRTARAIVDGFAGGDGAFARHPYPVTPYHPDFLKHADLAQSAAKGPERDAGSSTPSLRVRAKGALAERVLGRRVRADERAWDVLVEEISVHDLAAPATWTLHGGGAVPWVKEGWFHAYRLLEGSLRDRAARQAVDEAMARLTRGDAEQAVDRANVERALVTRLTGGCERVVAGYTMRREVFNNDYSAGVENVAVDALGGMDSAVFLRTVKLKDFPWNGWLTLGVREPPRAAWNPVAGFTDATGRLLWSALADPALFPEPYGEGWAENRVRLAGPPEIGPIAVPKDAVVPEPGTGGLRPVGEGRSARARLTYRVLTSAYHDGTRMTVADVLYGLAFGFTWSAAADGAAADPDVARATALARDWLVGVKVLRVETDVLRFGEVAMKYEVPIVEVYLAHALPEPSQLAAISPPWSAVPWHVLALLEHAARQGIGALSAERAKQRGVPWLDAVRDDRVRDRLIALAASLEAQSAVPPALKELVTAREARQRWGALRQFAGEHRHVLVTSGPYLVHAWSPGGAVLRVFRDFSYPLGVGSFNRYPLPLRGFVHHVEVRADRVEVQAEAERIERFAREYRVLAEPVGSPASQKDKGIAVACRYVAVAADGTVIQQGAVGAGPRGSFSVSRDGLPRGATLLLAIEVNGNRVNPQVRTVRVD